MYDRIHQKWHNWITRSQLTSIFRSNFNLYVLNKPAANLLAPSTCRALCLEYAGEPRTIVDFARRSLTAFAMDIVAGFRVS